MTRRSFLIGGVSMIAARALPYRVVLDTFDSIAISAKKWSKLPIGEVTIRVAREFLQSPYAGGTLDQSKAERCVVNLATFDCVTLVEISLAIARLAKLESLSKEGLVDELTKIRYRGGVLAGYESRLHYTTDWMLNNERKKVLHVLQPRGSTKLEKKIDFMSTHPESYMQLRENPALVEKIKKHEAELNKQELYHVPKEKLEEALSEVRTGDIVAFTTSVAGLDCAHMGFAFRGASGSVDLLHASSAAKQVAVSSPLLDYTRGIKNHIGLIVARPLEP